MPQENLDNSDFYRILSQLFCSPILDCKMKIVSEPVPPMYPESPVKPLIFETVHQEHTHLDKREKTHNLSEIITSSFIFKHEWTTKNLKTYGQNLLENS